jgi:hypothetical protein
MDDELRARARAWAERTCAEQRVPLHVDDRQVLAQVVALLRPGHTATSGRVVADVEMRAA